MKLAILLADSAQVDPSGKAHLLGLGWTHTSVPTGPMAIVVLMTMDDVAEARTSHKVHIALFDSEGKPAAPKQGSGPLGFTADVEPGPAVHADVPLVAPVVIQLPGGIELKPGEIYTWRAWLESDHSIEATWSFVVRA